MNPSKTSVFEALLKDLEGLGGAAFLLRSDDPDDVTFRLERENLVGTEENIFLADLSHDSSGLRNCRLTGHFLKPC